MHENFWVQFNFEFIEDLRFNQDASAITTQGGGSVYFIANYDRLGAILNEN